MPRLRFVSTVEGVSTIELDDPIITIGRGVNNVVCIEDANISKHHALLIQEEGSYKLFDLHSVNGTAVNGERITVSKLKEGDAVRIGYLELKFEIAAPAPAAAPKLATAPAVPHVIEAKPGATAPALGARPRLGFGAAGKPVQVATASASATNIAAPAAIVVPPPAPVEQPAAAPAPAKEEKRVMIQVPAEKKPMLMTGPPQALTINAQPPAHGLGGPRLRPSTHIEPPAAPAPVVEPVAATPEPPAAPVAPAPPSAPAAPIQRLGGLPRLRPSVPQESTPPAPTPEPAPEPAAEPAPEPVASEAAPEPAQGEPAAPAAAQPAAGGPKKFGAAPGQGAPKFRLKRE